MKCQWYTRLMRIAYCTNVRLPNERAHGHQIAAVVDALAGLGHDVEIFAPYRKNPIKASFQGYYGLQHPIPLHLLGSFDGIASAWTPGILGLTVTTALFGRALTAEIEKRTADFDLLFTRTPELLPALTELGKPVIVELHKIPRRGMRSFLRQLRKCRLIVTLTSPMRNALIEKGVTDVPIIVEGDAVDSALCRDLLPREEVRAQYSLPLELPLVGFAGQLESMGLSKGIPELLEALHVLKKRGFDCHCVIAGGPDRVKDRIIADLAPELVSAVTFVGFIPHLAVPSLLSACDALVYPAPLSDHPFYVRDTSPLKLFEYMACGRPIVAADLLPLRDVLSASNSFLYPVGDSEAFASALKEALVDKEAASARAGVARTMVENFTWDKRMTRILGAARLSADAVVGISST